MRWYYHCLLFVLILTSSQSALAFYSTSTNFSTQHKVQSISGRTTSTNFMLFQGGGQTADARSTSTSFLNLAGIWKFLVEPIKPDYEQIHYHWRNDDNIELLATSATTGTEDTALTNLAELTAKRLRLEVSNEGGTRRNYSSQSFRLEYGLLSSTCSAISTWVNVGDNGGDWDMSDSTYFILDGLDSTNISVSAGGVSDANQAFLSTNGGLKDTSSQLSAVFLPSNSFIEMEFSVKALAAATDGGTYCFRVTNAGSNTNYSYTVYPQATIASAQTLSFSVSDNTIGFGNLSAASASYATGDTSGSALEVEAHTLIAATSATNGYVITVKGATLTSGANTIDAIGGTNTASSAGSEQFGLRMSATGGSGSVTAPYAASGFAYAADGSTTSQVASASSGGSATTYSVRYIANISNITEAASYSTVLTYTITGNF